MTIICIFVAFIDIITFPRLTGTLPAVFTGARVTSRGIFTSGIFIADILILALVYINAFFPIPLKSRITRACKTSDSIGTCVFTTRIFAANFNQNVAILDGHAGSGKVFTFSGICHVWNSTHVRMAMIAGVFPICSFLFSLLEDKTYILK